MKDRLFYTFLTCLALCFSACNNNTTITTGNKHGSDYEDNYVPGVNDIQLASNLALNSLYPSSGPLEGGTAVDVIGTGFSENSQVYIGGKLCTNLVYRSSYRLTVTTPAGTLGPALVKVVVDDEYSQLPDGFTYYEAVKVTGAAPTRGVSSGGDQISIKGKGFTTGTSVKIGSLTATISAFASTEELTVTTPPLTKGSHQLVVSNINGSDSLSEPINIFNPPALNYLDPAYGPLAGGTTITVNGDGLVDGSSLWLDNKLVMPSATSVLGETATMVTPAATKEGVVNLKLGNNWGQDTLSAAFVYVDDSNTEARILSTLPGAGPAAGGNQVTIIGYGLPAAAAKVYFGPNLASCSESNSNRYRCQVPAGSDGQVDIKISGADGELILASGYRYVDLAITALNPTEGSIAGGQLVTISGKGLTADTMVLFNGNAATFEQLLTSQQMVVRIPAGQVGPATVTISRYNVQDVLPDSFTYYNNANKIDWITGGKINGTINAFIYDSWYGQPLKDAYLLVGSDVETGLGAFSNEKGMVTISSAGLRGPLPIVTASKPGYSNLSYVMVDGRDMIFWLVPYPESDPPPSTDEQQTDEDSDGDSGNGNGNDGSQVVITYPAIQGTVTRVKDVNLEKGSTIWVFPTNNYDDGVPYVTSKTILQEGGTYNLSARVGDVAIVALAGDYDEKGNFIAKNMGMAPFEFLDYDKSYRIDIVIDTPLDSPMEVEFVNAPLDETTPTTSLIVNMDLGALGFLPFPRRMGDKAKETYYLPSKLPHNLGEIKVHLRAGIYGPNYSVPMTEVRSGLVDHTKTVKVDPLLGVLLMQKPTPQTYFADDYEFIFAPNNNPPPYPTFNQYYFIDGITGRTSWMIFSRGDTTSFTLPHYDGLKFGSPFNPNFQTVITQSYYVPELSFDDMDDYRVLDWISRSYNYDYFSAGPIEDENGATE